MAAGLTPAATAHHPGEISPRSSRLRTASGGLHQGCLRMSPLPGAVNGRIFAVSDRNVRDLEHLRTIDDLARSVNNYVAHRSGACR